MGGQPKTADGLFRSWAFWGALSLLLVSQIFYLGLSFSALQKLHEESSLAVEKILLEDLARRFGYTVRTGRALHRYPRLNEEMARILSLSRAEYFLVADTRGRVLGGRPPGNFFPPPAGVDVSAQTFEVQVDGRPWLGRAITGPDGEPAGYVFLTVGGPNRGAAAWRAFQERRWSLLVITVLSAGLLALALAWARRRLAGDALSRFQIYGLFLGSFLLGQFGFQALNLGDLAGQYRRQNLDIGGQLARTLVLDLEKIMAKNVLLRDIPGLDRHLETLRRGVPLVDSMEVTDQRGRRLAWAGPEDRTAAVASGEPEVVHQLSFHGLTAGQVEVRLSARVIRTGWVHLLLDNLTMTLVAALLLLELARLIIPRLRPSGESAPAPAAGRAPPVLGGAALMRPLVFAAVFALDMSVSFIPLKMAALNPAFAGLSPALLLSLPVSVEMALAGLVMISGAFWTKRLGGWRPLFLTGLLLAGLGYVLSGLAAAAGVYVLARGLAGMGYGALNFASQVYVVDRASPGQQGEALGDLFAGFFSGGLCGCAAGGLLADRLGFNPVFFVAAAIFFTLSLTILFLPKGIRAAVRDAAPASRAGFGALVRFLRSRPIWNLGFLSVLPAAVALVGLVNYFLPIHLSGLGAGPAVISQLNVLFSLLVVVLGPGLGRCLDRGRRPHLFLVLAGLLAAAAFFSFPVWPTLAGAAAAMIGLGLSNAISENGHPAYLLSRPEIGLVGRNQALSVYNAFVRLGQVAGPLVLAAALGWKGPAGLAWLGGLTAALTLMFWRLAPKGEEH